MDFNFPYAAAWTLPAMTIAISIIIYGFLASALPVWLLLAPRDYLSTFVKLGVIVMLAAGILLVRPELQMPALTKFMDGTGPGRRRENLPVLLHHHRLRSDFRLSLAHLLRHYAEDAGERGPCHAGGLRFHAARKLCRHHGDDRGLRARPGVYFAITFACRSGR
jgi:hypothetical protein